VRPPERADWKIISITGHRKVSVVDHDRIFAAMKVLVRNPTVDAIYVGGALGADTIALRAAAEYREGKKPHITVVVPDTADKQPWDARKYFHLADEVVELKKPIQKSDNFAAFKERNAYLVDHASVVVAFFSGNWASGTGHALRYAKSRGVETREIKVAP
jgi:uncharacterized phage-like protein YoqJ